jgi:SAM-dependent methyltransferase
MGVFTNEGKVAAAMYDKSRQINRFIEAIDEIISNRPCEGLNVIDFGCGKGYLTFLLYYYLVKIKNIKAHVTGVDVKEELMLKCRNTAEEYGYDDLHFQCGDIRTFQPGILPDMRVSLHACDTATDYVLYNGIRWNVRMIFSMPCCQHELNHQMESGNFPILTRYGLLKENISSVFTDALRGNILTAYGYTVRIMDIVNPLNTPKNILIRAVKSEVDEAAKQKALEEALRLCGEFGLKPTLLSLLHL